MARAVLEKGNLDEKLDSVIQSGRDGLISELSRNGRTRAQAVVIVDQYLIGALRAREPELRERLEVALTGLLTVPELRAALGNGDAVARRSALAKLDAYPKFFAATGQAWANDVSQDVLTRKRATFDRLGLN